MSTYETTAGLGDERVRILPRRGLVKNHYYTRATHGIVEVMWSNRGAFVERRRCEALKSLTRDETFVSEALPDNS